VLILIISSMFLEPDHALVTIVMACDGNLVQLEAGWPQTANPYRKKGIFEIIKAKKNVLTNYIIKFRSGGGFYFRQEGWHSMRANGRGSAGTHT
jgi:hypothetical protein